MNHLYRRLLISATVMAMVAAAVGQTSTTIAPDTGLFEIEGIQGTFNSSGSLLKIDSQLGYDFNKHFGIFTGVPIYFTSFPSGTTSSNGTTASGGTNTGLGNFYLGFTFRAPNPIFNYGSSITLGAPTGDAKKGLSTGRGTIDWNNHFDHSFHRLTPFFEAGLSNTVSDSMLIARPFTSLGKVGHFEEGAEYSLHHHFSVGASAYQIVPFGTQKVFSKLIRSGQGAGSKGAKSKNAFQQAPVTIGNDLTREDGFNTWIGIQPSEFWRAEVGYSRSATFDLDSFSFNLSVNFGKLLRSRR